MLKTEKELIALCSLNRLLGGVIGLLLGILATLFYSESQTEKMLFKMKACTSIKNTYATF